MRVRMIVSQAWQHAGREQALMIGQIHDLPDLVGAALVASGAAMAVPAEASAPTTFKPGDVPEHGRRRRRAS